MRALLLICSIAAFLVTFAQWAFPPVNLVQASYSEAQGPESQCHYGTKVNADGTETCLPAQ
jgi:hypothetical protein